MAVPLTSYKTPGVYVQEIAKLPPSVAQVDTAVPVFIGYTEKAVRGGDNLLNVPTRITSMDQYTRWFGDPKKINLQVTVSDLDDPTKPTSILAPKSIEVDFRMYYAAQMFFDNGGGECYILSVGTYSTDADITESPSESKLWSDAIANILKKELEPTLIVIPDLVGRSSATPPGANTTPSYLTVYQKAMKFCNDPKINNYFVVMDVAQHSANTDSPVNDAGIFRNIAGNIDEFKYGAAYYPYVVTTLPAAFDRIAPTSITVLGLGPAPDSGAESDGSEDNATTDDSNNGRTLASIVDSHNQLFNQIIDTINNQTRLILPPSAAMAGIYASTDNTRGVFKAPANAGIANVLGPSVKISDQDQDDFNVDTTGGKSINVIRAFRGMGTLVWGARTLAGNDREWRYISVRRFFNMVEESVKRSLFRFVFEPNNPNTWVSIRASIEAFLETQWRSGALLGNTPNDAYFVRVGVPETFSEAEMLDGFMVVEIGMAVVRPAEFIVLKFMHKFELGQQ